MFKIFTVLLIVGTLTGCQKYGFRSMKNEKLCFDGVLYHHMYGSKRIALAPAYNTDCTLQPCKDRY